MPKTAQFSLPEALTLAGGGILPDVVISFTTAGTLSAATHDVICIFHALTANSNPQEWWPGLVGPGTLINPDKYFIVCANVLGSCYGTTGPSSPQQGSDTIYGLDFPLVTIQDMVACHKALREHLGIEKIFCGIGGSMGGQQLLEWAVQEPDRFNKIVPVATNSYHSAWGIAFNTAQRQALESDVDIFRNEPNAGAKGLQAARAIAMLSYRNQQTYNHTQTDSDGRFDEFSAESYQRYQGQKLSNRFDAHTYYALSKAMDSHNVGRNFSGIRNALQRIDSEVLAIGITSDLLFPLAEQEEIAAQTQNGTLKTVTSLYGHDGFLIEHEQLTRHLRPFLNR